MLDKLISLLIEYNEDQQIFISHEEFGKDAEIFANKLHKMLTIAGFECNITTNSEDYWVVSKDY